jgi:two-component system LytT family response regulator
MFMKNFLSSTRSVIGRKAYFSTSDILFLEGDINYTFIHFITGKKTVIAQTLGTVHTKIDDSFVRINRKYIVNRNFITSVSRDFVELTNKQILPISRRRRGII